MIVKLIDPEQRETWIHPEDPGFVVEYRAYAAPTLTTDINVVSRLYINYGVTSVTHGGKAVIEPKTGWSATLPSDIQTILFILISQLSKLTPEEVQDLPTPPGSVPTEKPTVVKKKNAKGKGGGA